MARYALDGQLDFDKVGEEIVIYEANGDLCVLNDTASFIFEKIQEGLTGGEISQAVTALYDVSEERSLRDIAAFSEKLQEKAILFYDEANTPWH